MSELPPRELSAVRIPQPIRGAAVCGTSSIKASRAQEIGFGHTPHRVPPQTQDSMTRAWRTGPVEVRFAVDSPLEEEGFEPSVP